MNNQIICDTTTMMMMTLLRESAAAEPPDPADMGSPPWDAVEEAARRHNEWDKQYGAVALMLSARLLMLAQEQLP